MKGTLFSISCQVVSLKSIEGIHCLLEQETLYTLFAGWVQKRIQA